MNATTWTVWSPDNRPVMECATLAEARAWAAAFKGELGVGEYWISQN